MKPDPPPDASFAARIAGDRSPLSPAAPPARFSNLQLRLFTAAIGLPVLVAVIILGGWPFALAAGLVALLAAIELVHGFLFASMPISAVAAQGFWFAVPAAAAAGAHWSPRYLLAAMGIAVLMALAGYAPTNALGPRKPYRVLAGAIVYVSLPLAALVLLRDFEHGRDWVFLALLASFAVDTGAYATGKLFGRHRLAPRISPGKTWEGVAGGFLAGIAAVFLLERLFGTPATSNELLPLALLLPPAAMAGDLFESWLKRRMGVKDASGFLPGHGGLLDRLDSILFVVPLVYGFARWVL